MVEECLSAKLHDNMDISYFMVQAQLVEVNRLKMKIKDTKRAMSYENGSSKGRLEIQYKPILNKRFSNQVPSKVAKAHDYRVPNPNP